MDPNPYQLGFSFNDYLHVPVVYPSYGLSHGELVGSYQLSAIASAYLHYLGLLMSAL